MSRILALVMFSGVLVFVVGFGGQLPDRAAVHFDVAGHADGYMSRNLFVLLFSLLAAGAPQFVRWWVVREARDHRASRGAEELARDAFLDAVAVRADAIAIALCLFLGYLFALVVRANLLASEQPRIDMSALVVGLVLFLLFCAAWYMDYLRLHKAFSRSVRPS